MLRFYRTTEGIVAALSLFVAACAGLTAAWPAVTAGPVAFSVPFAILGLVLGGAGVALWADAAQRLFEAVTDHFSDFIAEVLGS